MSEPIATAYVVTWRYGDGSASGATAVFLSKARAERMLEILNASDSMRNHKIEAVPLDAITQPEELP